MIKRLVLRAKLWLLDRELAHLENELYHAERSRDWNPSSWATRARADVARNRLDDTKAAKALLEDEIGGRR